MKKVYLYKMKKHIKSKWVKALESGKYKKTKHQLKYNSAFCCLGVLTNLNPGTKWGKNEHEDDVYLSPRIKNWAGIEESTRTKNITDMSVNLADMNDGDFGARERARGKSFKQIAQYIRKNIEGI